MNLYELIQKYINKGYEAIDASTKVSQDIVLLKIFKSSFKNHITIKGGVVMHNISNDIRRATRDMDMDFIKYSLDDKSIEENKKRLKKTKKYDINISTEAILFSWSFCEA